MKNNKKRSVILLNAFYFLDLKIFLINNMIWIKRDIVQMIKNTKFWLAQTSKLGVLLSAKTPINIWLKNKEINENSVNKEEYFKWFCFFKPTKVKIIINPKITYIDIKL